MDHLVLDSRTEMNADKLNGIEALAGFAMLFALAAVGKEGMKC